MTVLVVGGGLSGLSTAMFMALHGAPPLLIERHPTTSVHPKARGQFPHVMEALRVAGVDEQVTAASPPDGEFRIIRAVSLNGPVLQEIMTESPDFSALSQAPWANVSQERMEPILVDRARELGADLRFNTELVSFEQHENGITARLRNLATGEEEETEVDYLVAADGHRSPIREKLGIELIGRGVLGEGTGTLFEADLGHRQVLCYLLNSDLPGGAGVLVSTDVPGRYAVGVSSTDSPKDWVQIIRTATGIPDLEPKVLDLPHGRSQTTHGVAERFSEGRIHLVGDAARLMPPTGAFGGNTAIMDGFHLAWKLAMVTRGEAGPGLLASHDPERRPYSKIIADQQLLLFSQRGRPDLADDPALPKPVQPVSALFFGCRQLGGAIIADPGDPGDLWEDPAQPTGRPGVRAPYVKLRNGSTTDLLGRGFVLLTGYHAYRDIIAKIEVHVLDEPEFFRAYGISPEGATLVRPDFVIAWRSRGFAPEELEKAWRAVLDWQA
ncbi:FAD-dependent monooxygenase [Kutzneria sp. CA-103260]|uniref:FAD-dependent monooxygenase n=1 Tax=Kutzneria sp. CA-103260 TaxID=2802641 RepID=UPI001BEE84AF|nr:FAD-dependent monooxygenase [Kutzneria sp. CA-103260]QUQ66666.1 FAD-dependent oxidoreductase [Kutzneria sp. CA-103260]